MRELFRHGEKGTGRSLLRRWLPRFFLLGAAGLVFVFAVDSHVRHTGARGFVSREEAAAEPADCILVLGAAVWEGDRPCPMLEDRLLEGIALYEAGAAPILFLTGDGTEASGNETAVMRRYVLEAGVPEEAILVDPEGFCTYDSMLRAREVYQMESIIAVTQEYHLGRAVYIAQDMGLEVRGVASDPRPYAGQLYHDLREIVARMKDFILCEVLAERS